MPEMDGYEVCRRLRAEPATQLPADRDGHGQRRARRRWPRSRRARTTSSPSRSTRPSCWRACGRCCASSATTTRSSSRPRELAEWNGQLEQRVEQQVEQLERVGRLKRFLSPQLVEMVVSSGDESFLESHRRDITVVFCDLRGFTPFAESVEPEDVMVVLGQYHAALGELVHRFEGTTRALRRRRADGVLQRPAALPGRAGSAPCGWRSRCASG